MIEEAPIMEAAQQGEIIHRVAGDGVVEINVGRNVLRGAQDVPEREVLVHEAALLKLKQRLVALDLSAQLVCRSFGEEGAAGKETQMAVEVQMEVIRVPGMEAREPALLAQHLRIEGTEALRLQCLPARHGGTDGFSHPRKI